MKHKGHPFPDGVPPSPSRTDGAICEWWAQCGGCATPHVALDEQRTTKKRLIQEALAKVGWEMDLPMVGGEPWGYRSRMDFAVFEFGFGQRRKGSFRGILPVKDCLLADKGVRDVLARLWPWFEANKDALDPYHVARQLGTVKYAVVRSATHTESMSVSFVLNEAGIKREEARAAIEAFAAQPGAPGVVWGTVPAKSEVSILAEPRVVSGDGLLTEKLLGRPIRYHSQGFFQVNTRMVEVLLGTARGWVGPSLPSPTQLWDLYGGAGTFSVALGDLFPKTLVLDNDGPNVALAEGNLAANGIQGQVVHLDAADLGNVGLVADPGTLCILDPPRAGLHPKAQAAVMDLAPPWILYVSCNPAQFAREWPVWSTRYEPVHGSLFDLFPQTPHAEMMTLLRRKV